MYDGVTAAFAYDFPVDALIQKFKYGPDLTLAPVLGRLLGNTPCGEIDAVLAMPLGAARLRDRGFNQAQELARVAARIRGVPLLARACRKVSEHRRRRACRGKNERPTCAAASSAMPTCAGSASPSSTT